MEWLAGGRMPSWASPYSAQATAALLAQFPTQWPTIRDYGFAHPALVPFINEDPMMVCSLIPSLGWIREISIGAGASIPIGDILEMGDVINYKVKGPFQSGSRLGGAGTQGFYMFHISGNIRYYDTSWVNVKNISMTTYYTCSWNTGTKKVTIDGTQSNFNCYYSGKAIGISNDGQSGLVVQYYEIEGKRMYIPCKHEGGNGMLDVLTATFIPKSGTGEVTISESPAS